MLIDFKTLFAKHNIKTSGVLHLGANTGQEAQAYHEQGIKTVVWIEAIPALFRRLEMNLLPYSGQVAIKACLSDKDGEQVSFHIANNEGQSSSMFDFGTHAREHPTVKFVNTIPLTTRRVDTLLKERGIEVKQGWFLNVDLQGAELLALRGMGDLLWKFGYAYIEVNDKELYKGCPLTNEIDDYLAWHGFAAREVKMTGAGWGDKFYSKS